VHNALLIRIVRCSGVTYASDINYTEETQAIDKKAEDDMEALQEYGIYRN
jgi:hypothetical protein